MSRARIVSCLLFRQTFPPFACPFSSSSLLPAPAVIFLNRTPGLRAIARVQAHGRSNIAVPRSGGWAALSASPAWGARWREGNSRLRLALGAEEPGRETERDDDDQADEETPPIESRAVSGTCTWHAVLTRRGKGEECVGGGGVWVCWSLRLWMLGHVWSALCEADACERQRLPVCHGCVTM